MRCGDTSNPNGNRWPRTRSHHQRHPQVTNFLRLGPTSYCLSFYWFIKKLIPSSGQSPLAVNRLWKCNHRHTKKLVWLTSWTSLSSVKLTQMVKEGSKNKMTWEKDRTEVVLQQARQITKKASKAEGRTCAKTLKWECAWCVQERARGTSIAGGHDGDNEVDVGYVAPRSRLNRALEATDLLWVRQNHGKHLSWAVGWSDITVWMKTFAGLLHDSTLCTKTYPEKTSWGLNRSTSVAQLLEPGDNDRPSFTQQTEDYYKRYRIISTAA